MYLAEGFKIMVVRESFFCREILALMGDLTDLEIRGLRYFLETMVKILVLISLPINTLWRMM